jgi:molybdenum cofactor cytidylyltransferase
MEIEGVVLAAGYSSRANGFKMEFEIDGKAMIKRCIESLYDSCTRIIVVSGYKHEKIEALVKEYSKVEVVYNEDFHKGMFSSVKKGIASVKAERFFLTPGDYPFINKEVCTKLIQCKEEIVIPSFNNSGGHPILLNSSLIEEILMEAEDSNLKIFLNKKNRTYVDVNDEGILIDIDTRL